METSNQAVDMMTFVVENDLIALKDVVCCLERKDCRRRGIVFVDIVGLKRGDGASSTERLLANFMLSQPCSAT